MRASSRLCLPRKDATSTTPTATHCNQPIDCDHAFERNCNCNDCDCHSTCNTQHTRNHRRNTSVSERKRRGTLGRRGTRASHIATACVLANSHPSSSKNETVYPEVDVTRCRRLRRADRLTALVRSVRHLSLGHAHATTHAQLPNCERRQTNQRPPQAACRTQPGHKSSCRCTND